MAAMQTPPPFGHRIRRPTIPPPPLQPPPVLPELERELADWKAARRKPPFPWRPFLLMAGLCLGIGGLVLPQAIGDTAQNILTLLGFFSFISGLAAGRKKDAKRP